MSYVFGGTIIPALEILCCLSDSSFSGIKDIASDTGMIEAMIKKHLTVAKTQGLCVVKRNWQARLIPDRKLKNRLRQYWRASRTASEGHVYVKHTKCLRCEGTFWSRGPANRMCSVCAYINSTAGVRRVNFATAQ